MVTPAKTTRTRLRLSSQRNRKLSSNEGDASGPINTSSSAGLIVSFLSEQCHEQTGASFVEQMGIRISSLKGGQVDIPDMRKYYSAVFATSNLPQRTE